jgi:hypothetical protein
MPWQTNALFTAHSGVTFDVGLNTTETAGSRSAAKRKRGCTSCNPSGSWCGERDRTSVLRVIGTRLRRIPSHIHRVSHPRSIVVSILAALYTKKLIPPRDNSTAWAASLVNPIPGVQSNHPRKIRGLPTRINSLGRARHFTFRKSFTNLHIKPDFRPRPDTGTRRPAMCVIAHTTQINR